MGLGQVPLSLVLPEGEAQTPSRFLPLGREPQTVTLATPWAQGHGTPFPAAASAPLPFQPKAVRDCSQVPAPG